MHTLRDRIYSRCKSYFIDLFKNIGVDSTKKKKIMIEDGKQEYNHFN